MAWFIGWIVSLQDALLLWLLDCDPLIGNNALCRFQRLKLEHHSFPSGQFWDHLMQEQFFVPRAMRPSICRSPMMALICWLMLATNRINTTAYCSLFCKFGAPNKFWRPKGALQLPQKCHRKGCCKLSTHQSRVVRDHESSPINIDVVTEEGNRETWKRRVCTSIAAPHHHVLPPAHVLK